MPDHIHLLWTGVAGSSNQLVVMKSFRKDLNDTLGKIGLQLRGFDHVLKEGQLKSEAIEAGPACTLGQVGELG